VAHDVGNPCVLGDSTYDAASGTYSVTGSGTDIWQGGDQFQYAYRIVPGDFSSRSPTSPTGSGLPAPAGAKSESSRGEDCTFRSRYAMMQDHGEDLQDATRFAARPTYGGADNFEQLTLAGGVHRDWMRLDRRALA
jgi:hypothetical protein